MARGVKWGCSYKRTTLIVCSINIFVALYVLRSLYGSLYIYSNDLQKVVKYTPDQISKMEESIRIRKANQPKQLMQLVKELSKGLKRDEKAFDLPVEVKRKISDEILRRLKSMDKIGNITQQREAVDSWRREKLQELRQLTREKGGLNSSTLQEAGVLLRALESDWAVLSENIGLWIPTEYINQVHDDKPAGVEEESEEDILPGRPVPPECHAELHTDYDGAAVRWGLTHHKDSAADCCQACFDQAKNAKPGEKKCNIWVYCPDEMGCYSPDIYEHKNQECWLKYAEKPRLNFKDKYSESYRNAHPNAPLIVPWVSGVIRT
ncbi:uncharacterized protein [Euphorbia lathyris]|uniref:uncharacterized protein n=1 Tax=Euphorbia lathyris TaxID=212925 RepID=UPI0033136DFD